MTTASFAPTGAVQFFTVPVGITVLRVDLGGGAGIAVPSTDLAAPDVQAGGRGALVTCFLTVTPGEQLWLAIGPGGATGTVFNGTPFGRGGARGGGAASMLGRGEPTLANALLVAGGGGGGGEDGTGGSGGGIGGRGTASQGSGLGGGQDATYTADTGEGASADGTGGGGGGVRGGRAGAVVSDRRGGGGGGSSRIPSGGSVSADSISAGFARLTYGLAPLAPTAIGPAAGDVVAQGRACPLAWGHNGAVAGDVQTGASVTYTTPAGSGSFEVSGDSTGGTIPAALMTATGTVTWRVVTRGQGGTASPETTATFAIGAATPTPVITTPAVGDTVTQTPSTVAWTASDQGAYRLRITDPAGAAVLVDTGLVVDSGARSAQVPFTANGSVVAVRLSVRGASGVWSDEAVRTVPITYPLPAAPALTATPDPIHAAIAVTVTHPTMPGRPLVVATRYSALALAGEDAGQVLPIAVGVDPDGVARWRNPRSGVPYVLAAEAVAAAGGTAVATTEAPGAGYGRSPYGAAPYGS